MRFCGRNCVQAARKPNSVLDDHSSRRGVTDALDSNLPAGFDSCFHTSLRLTATGRCVISPEEWAMISLPIWSCSVWGLPSRRHYCRRGGLLPHRFTLTAESYMGRFLSRPAQISEAVCFLLHWPSSGVETGIPDVIRHTTLRSSDFPPPRSACASRGSDHPAACTWYQCTTAPHISCSNLSCCQRDGKTHEQGVADYAI